MQWRSFRRAFPWRTVLLLSAVPALALVMFLGWLRWELQPLQRYYLFTYWECSEGLKQPRSATPVEWLYKTAPGRKDKPVIDSDVISGGPWKLSLELSPAAREQGWTELGKTRPEAVRSSELEPFFQDYLYDHRSVRQLLAEPLLYASIVPFLVLYIALMLRKDLGLEWSRLCDEVSDSEFAFHWKRNRNQFALYSRSWIHRVIEAGMSQLKRGRLDSSTSTPSIHVPDTYQQAQSSAMKSEKQLPSSTPKKQPQRRSIFPGTASVSATNKQPKPWDKSQWID